jgi:hypothetical protein
MRKARNEYDNEDDQEDETGVLEPLDDVMHGVA